MENYIRKQFSENFKRIRKSRKLSQEEVAERSNMSLSYISTVETGIANPTLSTAEKLAQGLGVDVQDLFAPLNGKMEAEEMRKRIKYIVDGIDAKGIHSMYNAVLTVFKPGR